MTLMFCGSVLSVMGGRGRSLASTLRTKLSSWYVPSSTAVVSPSESLASRSESDDSSASACE